ncbi:phosphate signaling complex protein PhoU [Nocardioides sp. Kera G14]|uniref:phosphate signaling complex protein PhoU n=1 Tax=Nocardioides sp. Kera G14 TaxID=2884264 RepID=UPI001D1072E9|nr:phosphate signaling complex protein PhoU [Nocardioides sp. Kera G14]UDY24178.1 phosphate signaling complex protein PhoU [Nocardioides sp. Kera G14]
MREAFHDELEAVFSDLADICDQVEVAVGFATQSLLGADENLAQQVITGDAAIDHAREAVEERCFELLAQQSPVAGDLRVIVAALRMVSDLERMGDLSVHVAKIARLRVPNVAVPEGPHATISKMAEVAEAMVHRTAEIIRSRDVSDAGSLAVDDEEMDRLRRNTFADMLGDDWSHGVEAAVDVALLGRYYERIADHAVSVANRIVFVVTGQNPAYAEA